MQFQGIDQSNDLNNLVDLGTNFNLPTANLNLDAQLIDGVRMHLKVYLSSQNHEESWVKGGHIQIDKLDFVKPGFMENIMHHTTITIGLDEFNYGMPIFAEQTTPELFLTHLSETILWIPFLPKLLGR